MKTVLIFGANGFVGPYLAREFAEHGYKVAASDIAEVPKSVLDCDMYVPCNLLDAKGALYTVSAVKPDILINLAAVSSVGQSWQMPQKTIEVNVVGALNVLEAARKQETAPKVLLIGSSEEYASSDGPLCEEAPLASDNPYGISKATQERFADIYSERFSMQIYHVRSFNHTGPGQADTFVLPSFCRQVAEIENSGKPGTIKVGNLAVERDFSDVRDVVRAYRLLVESDYCGQVFNIGSGIGRSLNDLLETACAFSEQDITIEIDDDLLRPADAIKVVGDITKAKTKLHWLPGYSIESTLFDLFQSYLIRR